MIVACELSMTDGAHVPFNAGLLATVRAAFPQDELLFLGAAGHIREIKRQLGAPLADSISWREIAAPGAGLSYWRRFVGEMRILRPLFRLLRAHPGSRLLLTSSYPSTLLATKILERFETGDLKIQAVLHGGLSGVHGKRHRHPVRRFQEMRTALTLFRGSKVRYLVLEDAVRDYLLSGLPALADRVAVLEHPLAPNEAEDVFDDVTFPVRFGFLGLATEAKGFPVFSRLAAAMTAKHGAKTEFHAIGRLQADRLADDASMDALATKPGHERLSRGQFIERMRPLHFTVLPFEPGYYNMSASGTLLDAIAWKKPILARRIAVFEQLFCRFGDVGYLFSDEAELGAIVDEIVDRPDRSRYRQQVANLRRAEKARLPETLAMHYREICRDEAKAS